ncbi:UNVERIFIED_CONTAM: Vesicle transport protein GOT1 [Sesamum radiatum]|uniref:Vesicle transport protein GOT1 n=1 Tax=Sesamum radiatum TaxID=300843 RepID=A0AAW2W7N3_SESRA
MMSFEMNDRKKIGLGLTGFGVFFSFLGIIFFFDKGLLAMGNILFFSGVTLTIGLKSSMQFFMKRSNFKGTVSFGVGFFLVIIGWPIIGMIIEAYGFVVLFSGFWPTLAVFLQKMPVIGWLFQQPFVRSIPVVLLGTVGKFMDDRVCWQHSFLIVIVEKEYLCKFSLEKCRRGTLDHFGALKISLFATFERDETVLPNTALLSIDVMK